MSAEATIYSTLGGLTAGRVYPDVAPPASALPRIVYQQVGGTAFAYNEGALPTTENGRFQVSCWAVTRTAAVALAKQAEALIVGASAFQAVPLGARSATYENDTQLYGCMQDFSINSTR